jgi:hypothetical protein
VIVQEERTMDWFEKLTGFPEAHYDATRAKLKIIDSHLHSLINGKSYGVGDLALESLPCERKQRPPDRAGSLG